MVLKVVNKEISDLIPYVNNARMHTDEQIDQIASSIKEFGFVNPVLIDKKNGIVAGHARILAAKKLKIQDVPTICLSDLTEVQIKAYILVDNNLATRATWDIELVSLELQKLKEIDFDIDLIGFDEEDFSAGRVDEISDFKDVVPTKLDNKCPRCGFEYD